MPEYPVGPFVRMPFETGTSLALTEGHRTTAATVPEASRLGNNRLSKSHQAPAATPGTLPRRQARPQERPPKNSNNLWKKEGGAGTHRSGPLAKRINAYQVLLALSGRRPGRSCRPEVCTLPRPRAPSHQIPIAPAGPPTLPPVRATQAQRAQRRQATYIPVPYPPPPGPTKGYKALSRFLIKVGQT